MSSSKRWMVLVGLLALPAGQALAGHKWQLGVSITRSNNRTSVYGPLGGARNSPNTVELIGCSDTGTVTCFAADYAGNYATCHTSNPTLIAVARSISGDSFLEFTFTQDGQCSTIAVTNASQMEPKLP